MTDTFLNNLRWRGATKKFDINKQVLENDLNKVLEAIRLAPTSFGLQPFHVFVVKDNKLRKKIQLKSLTQPQVIDASYLLIFCARIDINNRIDDYIAIASRGDEAKKVEFKPRQTKMVSSINKKTPEQLLEWSKHQAYIALGFGLAACAELRIDSCPIGGFEPQEVDKILELPPHLSSVVYLAIGYRRGGESRDKVRFPNDDLFTHL